MAKKKVKDVVEALVSEGIGRDQTVTEEVMRFLRRLLDVQHAEELEALKADVETWVKRN